MIISGVERCQKGVGAHRHVIYVPSVKNQYKRVVFETVHKIINWYVKNAK